MGVHNFEWTEDGIEKAAELWNAGLSASAIAAKIGVSRSSILGLANKNRELFAARESGTRIDKGRKGRLPDASVIASDLRSMTLSDVAKKYDCSKSAICVKLRRAGMPRGETGRGGRPKTYREEIIEQDNKRPGTVIRTTITGSKITMPRVTFIDGAEA